MVNENLNGSRSNLTMTPQFNTSIIEADLEANLDLQSASIESSLVPRNILLLTSQPLILGGIGLILKKYYPGMTFHLAKSKEEILKMLESNSIDLIILNSLIPASQGESATKELIFLLRQIMNDNARQNIIVWVNHMKSLIRVKLEIQKHQGGFAIVDKGASEQELLTKISGVMQGYHFIPEEIRNGIDIKEEWLEVLQLAFEEELQDEYIAKRLNKHKRTVGYYWSNLHTAFGIDSTSDKNIRIQTGNRARQEGWID